MRTCFQVRLKYTLQSTLDFKVIWYIWCRITTSDGTKRCLTQIRVILGVGSEVYLDKENKKEAFQVEHFYFIQYYETMRGMC